MDNEWHAGTGTMYDYGFRIYDPRIAKFLSVDPLTASYPMLTPYQFASNRPIDGIDLDGLEHESYLITLNDIGTVIDVESTSQWIDDVGKKGWGTEYKYVDKNDKFIYTAFDPSDAPYIWTGKDRPFYFMGYNLGGKHGSMEGSSDGANTGGKYGGQHGWNNGGKQLFFGTIGVVTAPFSIAAGGIYAVTGSLSLINSVDDIAGAISNSQGKSLLEQLTSDTNYENLIQDVKVGATFISAVGGGSQLWKMGVDGPTLLGTANDVNTIVSTYFENKETK